MKRWILQTILICFLCGSASAQEPEDLAYVLSRTVHIGNCSGVILPPQQDAKGNWHWFVASAAHCSTGSNRRVEILYPSDKVQRFQGREVVRFGGGGSVDMLIIEFTPSSGSIPYAEIVGLTEAQNDSTVVVTGFPARGNTINPNHHGLVWKPAKVRSIRDMVTIDQTIWSGNSGGPVWYGKKVLGIASTTDSNGNSHFTGPAPLHKGYHQACEKAGVKVTCSDGSCWDKIFGPGRGPGGKEPYKAPPNEDVLKLNIRIAELEARLAILSGQQPQQPPNPTQPPVIPNPNPAPVPVPSAGMPTIRVGKTTTLTPDSNATVTNSGTAKDMVLEFGIPQGEPGDDGQPGKITQAQIDLIIEQIEGDLTDQARRVIDELKKRIVDLENRKVPTVEEIIAKLPQRTYAISCVGSEGTERKLIQFVEKTPGNFVATVPPLEAVMTDLAGHETRTWFTFGVPITIKNRHFSADEIKAIAQEVEKVK